MTRRLTFAILAIALWAPAAWAVNRHVSPTGSGTACTPGSPCALSTANSQAQPGDVIHLANGTYTTAPIPARSGTLTARIEYRGNPADTGAVHVPATTVSAVDYATWRYMKFTGWLYVDPGYPGGRTFRNLIFSGCTIYSRLWLTSIVDSKVDSCRVFSDYKQMGQFAITPTGPNATMSAGCMRDTISNCDFTLNTGSQEEANLYGVGVLFSVRGGSSHPVTKTLFERNRIQLTFRRDALPDPADPGRGVRGAYFYGAIEDTFRHNKWTIIDSTLSSFPVDCGQRVSFRFRTNSTRNYFFRDSLIVGGRCGWVQMSSQSETNAPCVVGDQRWDECYFESTANGGGFVPFDFQYGMCRDTIQRSVFVTNYSSGGASGVGTYQVHTGPVLIDHNTFFSTSSSGSPLQIDPIGSYGHWASGAQVIVTNNIFYVPNGTSSSGSGAMYRLWSGRPFTANNNLYADYGRISVAGDRSLQYSTGCTGPGGVGCTTVRTSSPGVAGSFYQATGQDGASIHGSPGFVDSTMARFNPALLATSIARGRGTGGTDIGAYQFAGPDVIPPASVGDLGTVLVSDRNLILSWTAPGDDGMSGMANAYEMRRSDTAMDDGSFGSGVAVDGVPLPGVPGSPQTVALNGLTAGATYYFGIRARDESGNWSPIRYHTVGMAAVDQVPSAGINDLQVGP